MAKKLFDPIIGSAGQALDCINNILESSTEYSIFGEDLEGNILLWNEGARRLLGYDPQDVIGRANSAILQIPEDVASGKPQQVTAIALRDGKWEGTLDRLSKNGGHFSSSVVITPRCDAQGNPIGFLHISKAVPKETELAGFKPAHAEMEFLKQYSQDVSARLKQKNIELEERIRLAAALVEIGLLIPEAATLRQAMQMSAEMITRQLDGSLVQIWTLNEQTHQVELEACAGKSDPANAASPLVPIGEYKIENIAREGKPHVSNDVCTDPEAGDPEWARSQGIVSFAGHPLHVGQRVRGVIAAFGQAPFGPPIQEMFASLAIQLGQCISRRRAEEQLLVAKENSEAASRAAQDALDQLALALKTSGTGIWNWYAESDVVEWDQGTYQSFGVAPGSFGGSFQDFVALIHPEDRDQVIQEIQQCTPAQPEYGAEFRVVWPDGSVHRLDARGHAFYKNGALTRMTGTVHDVTEQWKMSEQLRQAQKMEAIGQLAGGIAHDFNNVLNVIIGYSRLLLRTPGLPDTARHRIEEIRKAGERAAVLTHQILVFSRKQVLEPKVLNLGGVLQDLEGMIRRAIGEDVEVITTVQENLTQVKIDPSQVQQVILNLVVNARDAMPQGGKLVLELMNMEVDGSSGRVHGVPAGKYVMLSVSDNGTGMPPAVQRHVFEPFFTTKGVGKGTGLGLATVHGIVKQSGGHIWLYSEPGIGTTFKIFLPSVDEPAEPASAESPLGMTGGEETILVVEDDPSLRALIMEILASVGFHVLVAAEGEEALRVSEQYQGRIHLLLTDVVLPKMSGGEIAGRMVASRPDIKVLLMSGYTGNALAQLTLNRPLEFIQKPWTPAGLCEKIGAVLGRPPAAHRVLVVDDDEGVRNWLGEVLGEAGYDVLTAGNGREARALARQNPVNLVITDLAMPEEEGIEMIQAMQKEHPGLIIVAMSGAFGQDMLSAARFLGAHQALEKPLSPEKVLQCIGGLLRVRPSG